MIAAILWKLILIFKKVKKKRHNPRIKNDEIKIYLLTLYDHTHSWNEVKITSVGKNVEIL